MQRKNKLFEAIEKQGYQIITEYKRDLIDTDGLYYFYRAAPVEFSGWAQNDNALIKKYNLTVPQNLKPRSFSLSSPVNIELEDCIVARAYVGSINLIVPEYFITEPSEYLDKILQKGKDIFNPQMLNAVQCEVTNIKLQSALDSVEKLDESIADYEKQKVIFEDIVKLESEKTLTNYYASFVENIDILQKDKRIKSITARNNTISIVTHPITVELQEIAGIYANFGSFCITLRDKDYSICGDTLYQDYAHPHIASTICWGSINDKMKELFALRDYLNFILYTLDFLQTYNINGWYIRTTRWVDESKLTTEQKDQLADLNEKYDDN